MGELLTAQLGTISILKRIRPRGTCFALRIRKDSSLRDSRGACMTRFSFGRLATLVAVVFFALSAPPTHADAQGYFGRNKVQYESFKWRIIKSDHFDNFFYPAESLLV